MSNTKYFMNKLSEVGIKPLLKNVDSENLAGIVTIEPDNAKRLFINLEKKNIFCSLREGKIRFSPHYYNTKDEIDLVVDELTKK